MAEKRSKDAIKVLLVDDDRDVIELLGKIFQTIGMKDLLFAGDGEIALALFQREKPDIVFSDYAMPKMDGVTLFKAIKGLNPKIPVVLFTGYYNSMMTKLEEVAFSSTIGEKLEPDYILKKPFRPEILVKILKTSFPACDF